MKKKTVITTETHEVWVVKETIPDRAADQTIDATDAIDVSQPDHGFQESDDCKNKEEK